MDRILINYLPDIEWESDDKILALENLPHFMKNIDDYIHEAGIKDVVITISLLNVGVTKFVFMLIDNDLTRVVYKRGEGNE